MPLNFTGIRGREVDGSRSSEYCGFCYRHGTFVRPNITLDEMKDHIREEMTRSNMPEDKIQSALENIPRLKRWTPK